MPPPLLLLFLSCPRQDHVFGAGHSVTLRWLFGPFIAAVPPVLAQSSCGAHILPAEPSMGRAPLVLGGCGNRAVLSTVTELCVQHSALVVTSLPVVQRCLGPGHESDVHVAGQLPTFVLRLQKSQLVRNLKNVRASDCRGDWSKHC